MGYPLKLSEQIKLLIEKPEYFLGFGKFTEPYPNKIVAKIAEEYATKPFEIRKAIKENFNRTHDFHGRYYPVKTMEDYRIVGGCEKQAMLSAAIFRKMGIPCALLATINPRSIFQDRDEPSIIETHTVNLVRIDGKWWMYDNTTGEKSVFIISRLIKKGYIPGAIYRDPSEVGISSPYDKCGYLLWQLKDVLLLDLYDYGILEHDIVKEMLKYESSFVEKYKNIKE